MKKVWAGALLSVKCCCLCKNNHAHSELAILNKKKHFGLRVTFWFLVVFAPLGMLFIMKTLEDEEYVVIKYKFRIFEILRVCFVIYCVSVLSLHIESNQLCDKSHCTFM